MCRGIVMTTRDSHAAIVLALIGVDPELDDQIDDIVAERLGLNVFSDEALAIMAEEYRRRLMEPALHSKRSTIKVGDIVVYKKDRTIRRKVEGLNPDSWIWSYPDLGEITNAGGPNLFDSPIESLADFEVESAGHITHRFPSTSGRH